MKKNGFTVVEMIISFSLISVALIMLFQLIVNLRTLYLNTGIKTELISKQSLISKAINEDFINQKITSISDCGNYCIAFSYENYGTVDLVVDVENKIFKYGDFATKLIDNSEFLVPNIYRKTFYNTKENRNDSYIIINIPIKHNYFSDEDFGITAVYQYDSRLNYLDIVEFN